MPKIIFVFFLSIFNLPIKAEIDNDAFRACLPASDFQGCMKVYKKSAVSNENKKIELILIPLAFSSNTDIQKSQSAFV